MIRIGDMFSRLPAIFGSRILPKSTCTTISRRKSPIFSSVWFFEVSSYNSIASARACHRSSAPSTLCLIRGVLLTVISFRDSSLDGGLLELHIERGIDLEGVALERHEQFHFVFYSWICSAISEKGTVPGYASTSRPSGRVSLHYSKPVL